MTEDELLKGITDALALRSAWDHACLWWHVRRSDLAQTMGTPGIPDVLVLMDGRLEAWELKTETGRLSDGQVSWKRELEHAGVVHRIIRPMDYDETIYRIVSARVQQARRAGLL